MLRDESLTRFDQISPPLAEMLRVANGLIIMGWIWCTEEKPMVCSPSRPPAGPAPSPPGSSSASRWRCPGSPERAPLAPGPAAPCGSPCGTPSWLYPAAGQPKHTVTSAIQHTQRRNSSFAFHRCTPDAGDAQANVSGKICHQFLLQMFSLWKQF